MSTVSLQMQTAPVYPLSREDSAFSDSIATAIPQARPNVVRRETDYILSYYQSEHAGRSYFAPDAPDDEERPSLARGASVTSQSSSEYSSDSGDRLTDGTAPDEGARRRPQAAAVTRHTRRPSQPSEGSADRRRLAIVELDFPSSSSHLDNSGMHNTEHSLAARGLLSRRGIHVEGLALVAPPDASPRTYTDLTPPPSAPIVTERVNMASQMGSHHRSASEAITAKPQSRLHHKSSRDVGIVGTAYKRPGGMSPRPDEQRSQPNTDMLGVPVFQTPTKSRSPSPAARSAEPEVVDQGQGRYSLPTLTARFGSKEPVTTPGIGEYKDISQPVIGPVVVGITSDMLWQEPSQSPGTLSPSISSSATRVTTPSSRSSYSPSPYLYYEPGVHSTAGPLPAPPRSIFDETNDVVPSSSAAPPRPPRLDRAAPKRDIAAIKEALQLPKSVSEVLASRSQQDLHDVSDLHGVDRHFSPEHAKEEQTNAPSSSPVLERPVHVREGAFPPSKIIGPRAPESGAHIRRAQSPPTTTSVPNPVVFVQEPLQEEQSDRDFESPVKVEASLPVPEEESSALRHESSWVSLRHDDFPQPAVSPRKRSELLPSLSRSTTPSSTSSALSPPVPPKSGRGSDDERATSPSGKAKRSTFSNFKRFSALPRTPSALSVKKSPSPRASRTPSPSVIHHRVSPRLRIRSAWPDAMQCHEIASMRSALERSMCYAQKINELARYECGLSEWVISMSRVRTNHASSTNVSGPLMLSTLSVTAQPRHASRSSMGSEATFPTRPDAFTATDLSIRPIDTTAPTAAPPSLPYPSLAQSPTRRPPVRSSTIMMGSPSRTLQLPLLPVGKSNGTGFFSSIGRKSSVKRDKSSLPPTPATPSRVLTKRSPNQTATAVPKQIPLQSAPSVPGGPRAAPGRVKRAQTISVSASPPVSAPEPIPPPSTSAHTTHRQSSMARRPSIFGRSRASGPTPPVTNSPEFEQQVDKLHDLLPHADRALLGAYLRRTGQDILAIGQYIEDEKNGTLRRE
ncbi:hypothetical protein CERSUDRAFT_111682 [Gelatoporia subvermispora B]|uniref:Uncharacterized protein n=1 Tax=Ceriporiopsis subvermispora (strain B) TaxID=914234 RepID=M2R9K4_CERS8|nr:hypothetical protein CERSUDRAFT_111682 [Gelatoporia subvermispora B]